MANHPVRKFFELLLIYVIVIVGIFVSQFKSHLVITENIGALHLSLATTKDENENKTLQNQFTASFKGFNISSSETTPVSGITKDLQKEPLVLESYSMPDSLSVEFKFTDGTLLTLAVSSLENNSELYVNSKISDKYTSIEIPYSISSSYTVEPLSETILMISPKNSHFTLNAENISDNLITFAKNDSGLKYIAYNPSKKFNFSSVAGLPGTDKESFDALSKTLRDSYVSRISQILTSADQDSLTEIEITAFVAENAYNGKYNEALDMIPDSFKKGNKRTYISTPYFNNLVNMNKSLTMQTDKFASMVNTSIDTNNLNIFAVDGITDYILREKKTAVIRNLLTLPAKNDKGEYDSSVAAGIIDVYCELSKNDKTLAKLIQPVIPNCLNSIAGKISLDKNQLKISTTTDAACKIASALIKYGEEENRNDCKQTGYLILNTVLNPKNTSLSTIAQNYRIIAPQNNYYPHTQILGYYGTKCVWVWTCSPDVEYTLTDDSIAVITIEFPIGDSHHMIFCGIPNFHGQIEIQEQMFRTDPRFETYNSSGYVYQFDSQTLLVKSRQKKRIETIRLFMDPSSNFTDLSGKTYETHARQE